MAIADIKFFELHNKEYRVVKVVGDNVTVVNETDSIVCHMAAQYIENMLALGEAEVTALVAKF